MRRTTATIGCAALAATLFTFNAPPASAGPILGSVPSSAVLPDTAKHVEAIQYRGRYYGRRDGGHRGNFGRNAGVGIGAAIIGGIILSEAARAKHRSSHGDDWERCSQTYRSFEPETGLYTGYDGERHTCPYLR